MRNVEVIRAQIELNIGATGGSDTVFDEATVTDMLNTLLLGGGMKVVPEQETKCDSKSWDENNRAQPSAV
jgi:hypothetical protein